MTIPAMKSKRSFSITDYVYNVTTNPTKKEVNIAIISVYNFSKGKPKR